MCIILPMVKNFFLVVMKFIGALVDFSEGLDANNFVNCVFKNTPPRVALKLGNISITLFEYF